MKIAFINQPWESVRGPAPRAGSICIWTWEVARRLAGAHDVVVYESRKDFGGLRGAEREGVRYRFVWAGAEPRIIRFGERYPRVMRILGLGEGGNNTASQPAAQGWYYAGYALQIALDIRRSGADVVHVHQESQFASIIRYFNPKVRIVLHMSCEWLSQFDRELIEPRLKAPDVILGCSDHISNLIRERFPDVADKCGTVPNGVDVGTFTPARGDKRAPRGPKRLLFAGRVSPEKGVHDLLEAFAIVVRSYPDVELYLVGEVRSLPRDWIVGVSKDPLVSGLDKYYEGGTYKTHLDRIVDANGLRGKVHFTGPVPNNALADRYHEADILINPSLSESFGMTVTEAMACGRPVVVTRTGGMAETVLHGKTGFIAPPANPPELASSIIHLLESDRLREDMGIAGRNRAVNLYSWDRVAERWLSAAASNRPVGAESMHAQAGTSRA